MDKELLYQYMRVKFREAGFSRAEIELHIQSFSERYQNKSEDEIEADIRRRGGPSRVVSSTIERRNTVLMADPDYRAFAESNAKPMEAAPSEESAKEEVKAVFEPVTEESVSVIEEASEDPLASWFASPAAEEELLPHTSAPKAAEKPEPAADIDQPNKESDNSATAEIPAVRSEAPKTDAAVKTEMPEMQNSAAHSAPHGPTPAMQDLGRTKVMGIPAAEQTKHIPTPKPVNANTDRRVPPVPTPQKRDAESYRKEQQAIWNTSNSIRDGQKGMQSAPARLTQSQTIRPVQIPQQKKPAAEKKKTEYSDRGNVTRLQEMTWWGEGSEEGVKRFRIIMACSAPFVAVLLLAYAVLAIALIVGMAALAAAFILGLVGWVAVGSLVALVAVIYGVSQLFLVMPVGMFELGLGVAAIGITMFVGILMYNIAVRLLPFLIRSFIRFQSVFRGFIQDLYYYVKGECYRR